MHRSKFIASSRSFLAAGLMLCTAFFCQAQPKNITVCGEAGEGPPWLYLEKQAAASAEPRLRGFTIDMFDVAFAQLGSVVTFRSYPWSRCLKLVAAGEIDFAAGAYFSEVRAKSFAYSKPYKVLTPQVFLLAESTAHIESVADLLHYKGCGMLGSSYTHYGILPGQLDQGSSRYSSMFKMLKLKRCDYLIEELEVVAQLNGGKDHYVNDPQWRHNAVAGASRPGMHLITSLQSGKAELIPLIDSAVEKMKKSGEFQQLWKKNAKGLPF